MANKNVTDISVIESIRGALMSSPVADSGGIIARKIRTRLGLDGYTLVQKAKRDKLQELLDVIYVDKRKTNVVEALDEARKLVNSL